MRQKPTKDESVMSVIGLLAGAYPAYKVTWANLTDTLR